MQPVLERSIGLRRLCELESRCEANRAPAPHPLPVAGSVLLSSGPRPCIARTQVRCRKPVPLSELPTRMPLSVTSHLLAAANRGSGAASHFNIRRGLRTQQCALCQRGVAGWECPPRSKHERFQRLVMYEALKVSGMVTAPTAEYMQEPINRFCAKRSKLHCFAAPHSS